MSKELQALADSQNGEERRVQTYSWTGVLYWWRFHLPLSLLPQMTLFYQMWLLIMRVLCAISGLTEGKLNHINSAILLFSVYIKLDFPFDIY